MYRSLKFGFFSLAICLVSFGCMKKQETSKVNDVIAKKEITAKDILGNPTYLAISYGGYRSKTRDVQPTIKELVEDMKLLAAMNVKIVRTYNVHFEQASNLLKAIRQIKNEDPNFEMYVMLGAWIDCKDAWTDAPDHNDESERNAVEIKTAVALANEYPEIVKILAVGNEAMVKWAAGYYVQPRVILKWVTHLQDLKSQEKLPKDLWITSSDNFAAWGGGSDDYHIEDLEKLIHAVDYISMHTYPMHDTHYNPYFWGPDKNEASLSKIEKIDAAMLRAKEHAVAQYNSVSKYLKSLNIDKPIHIGETGWASHSNRQYGPKGSRATDEYKEAIYYQHMRSWTTKEKIACFYFEAFDENWKDAKNENGSENHFGLFTIKGEAKFALWPLVDHGVFNNLTRGGYSITKTYNGNKEQLLQEVLEPSVKKNQATSSN